MPFAAPFAAARSKVGSAVFSNCGAAGRGAGQLAPDFGIHRFRMRGKHFAGSWPDKVLFLMEMNLRKWSLALISLFVQCHVMAQAQEGVPQPVAAMASEESAAPMVQVVGMRDPEWKSYKFMLNGVAAFEKKRALAPTAELRFILLPRRGDVSMQGLKLQLAADNVNIPVPLDSNNTFILPLDAEAKNANAELHLNRKMGSVQWFPYIRSAELKPGQRRLGDLRLECEIIWAIDYETIPFAVRNMIRAFGGPCSFSKGRFSFRELRTLASATLVSGARKLKLPVSEDTNQYTPPLHDKSWGDDSYVELEFTPVPASSGQPE